ncbi:MAG: universal stress protein [Haloarculaceae archaeon]
MYRILIPVDDDEDRAIAQAEFVADLPLSGDGIEVTVTHALHGEELDAPEAMRNPNRIATVRRARDALEDAGIEATIGEIAQPPAEGILDLAEEVDADLLVLGGRKQSPAGKVLFGSVTQEVLLETDRPVVVTGGGD